jgi:nucleoside-diphosphate-sugar epimerase
MHKKVYAITGVAGFIGSHIAEELLRREDVHVIGIDNFYSGTRDNIYFLENRAPNKFTFIEADIVNFESLSEVFEEYGVEYVFHQAAVASVHKSIEDPLFTHEVNVRGLLNVLEASRLNNVKKVLFASSAAVYGDEPTLPKNEYSLIKPISPYGCEKYMGEQYLKLYSELYGLKCVVLRYFNVYGPRQDPSSEYSGVISIFEDRFSKSKPVTIFGDGEQYRDFVYVKDVVKVNLATMDMCDYNFSIF